VAKLRLVHRCSDCGATHPKWSGKCTACGAWNSLIEDVEGPDDSLVSLAAGMALVPAGEPAPIDSIDASIGAPIATGIAELDSVLGGGLVPGSVTLLGGEPGIGKSTLLLQENIAVFDFELSADEMAQIAALDTGRSLFFDHRDPEIAQRMGTRRLEL